MTGVSNSMDPDQQNIGPDLVSNCLQNYQQTTPADKELWYYRQLV